LLAALAGRIYGDAAQQNAFPLDRANQATCISLIDMRLPCLVLILAVGCAAGRNARLGGTPLTCPRISPPGSPYPTISYATFVLDGKVIGARRAQRNLGPHNVEVIDTIPAVEDLGKRRIRNLRFLTPDSARLYEPCSGVLVVAVDSQRRWWWPW
jgi:hypothetical protein